MDRMFAPNADETLTELLEVSRQLSCEPSSLAIRWVLEQPAVSSAIVGARTANQFRKSLEAVRLTVPDEALARLTKVSEPAPRYPKSMEGGMIKRRSAAVKIPPAI